MRAIIPGILITFLFLSGFQVENNDITWSSEYKLKWSDFMATPDYSKDISALSAVNTNLEIERVGSEVTVKVSTVFVRNKSWVRSEDIENQTLLQHEQGHFDLHEVYARQIRSAISKERFALRNYELRINSVYDSIIKICHHSNAKYDKETVYSMDTLSQSNWNNYFSEELSKYSNYSNEKITIILN